MKFIIDRFEGDIAVIELEDGGFLDIPKLLVANAAERDCMEIRVDTETTNDRKKRVEVLAEALFED